MSRVKVKEALQLEETGRVKSTMAPGDSWCPKVDSEVGDGVLGTWNQCTLLVGTEYMNAEPLLARAWKALVSVANLLC